jgi:hypothetical protein
MFKYLLFLSATFYLTLLLAGQDNGQQRMGLRGAYDIALPPPPAPPAESDAPETIAAVPQPPTDTLRILPIPTVQPTSLTPEPAFIDVNTPTVTLRIITADAANVRDAASRTGTVIGRLENGEIVQVLGTSGDWVHVRLEGDGIDGFVHRRLISTEPPGLTASTLFPAVD